MDRLGSEAKKIILISTGTWCIFMNPFNSEPLTTDQLRKEALCYMSIRQHEVKSSRKFLGYIHVVNLERLTGHFGASPDRYRKIKAGYGNIAALNVPYMGRVSSAVTCRPDTWIKMPTCIYSGHLKRLIISL